jgi:hypothetical protein
MTALHDAHLRASAGIEASEPEVPEPPPTTESCIDITHSCRIAADGVGMWKAAIILLIAFVAFIGTTLEWGQTLDGRDDPCTVQGVDMCADDPATTTTATTTTTAPASTTAPATAPTAPTTLP